MGGKVAGGTTEHTEGTERWRIEAPCVRREWGGLVVKLGVGVVDGLDGPVIFTGHGACRGLL
jgi:hypothetical protein